MIPVRDGARWLGEAVESALGECGQDDEVVVVDDGSSDDPARVLPNDPRVVLLAQPALGLVGALELGRARCRGRYIARLDADDRALPGRVRAQSGLRESLTHTFGSTSGYGSTLVRLCPENS